MGKDKIEYSIKNEYEKYPKENELVIQNYINERLLSQIIWYDEKSKTCQKFHKRLSAASYILSACIPVFATLMEHGIVLKIMVITFSSLIAIISSLLTLNNYKELWIQYRSNCEMLKSELHKYFVDVNIEPSRKITLFYELVTVCEKYMTNEFNAWSDYYKNIHENQSSTSS